MCCTKGMSAALCTNRLNSREALEARVGREGGGKEGVKANKKTVASENSKSAVSK